MRWRGCAASSRAASATGRRPAWNSSACRAPGRCSRREVPLERNRSRFGSNDSEVVMQFRNFAVIGFVAGAVVAAGAQAARPQGAAPTVKDVLYSAADSIGMLRTAAEVDRLATMNYWATGTVVADGKPCKVKEYKASVNWLLRAMRVDYTCEGQSRRIEVVNGAASWNETEPGVNPSPAVAMAAERQLMIWTLPAGVIKAATAAGGKATVSVEGGKTILAFPLVEVP